MRKHLKYIEYISKHKFYVAYYCFQYGLHWRGLIHDWSKFLPSEWGPYADFFYGPKTPQKKEAFVQAWMKHIHRNPHHWQYWIHISDDGRVRPKEMPVDVLKEMIADWRGANRAQGGNGDDTLREWFQARESTIMLAPKTRRFIEKELGID